MTWFLAWLLAVELTGLAVLPLATRLFRLLPDRGYLFAKPLGILLASYLCWLLSVFGLLRFQRSTIAAALLILGVVCWLKWGRSVLRDLPACRAALLTSEALFLVSFAAASLVRAYNPEIVGTEKPMDFAFLNALYRGDSLPPEDPWMSGFSVSYYYFGYLLLATVAKLSDVPAAVGYNLGVAMVFAFLLAGSYSLSFNLLTLLRPRMRLALRLVAALLAPIMVGLMGNMEVGLELLALRGVGDASFWQWAGIKGLQPSSQPEGWIPTAHWWWWRASRVIPTIKPDGINEFPYFSFLLGDLHPHYTALPWALLAITMSLAALRETAVRGISFLKDRVWLALAAVALGFFLVGNSWDFPTYTGLFWLAVFVGLRLAHSPSRERASDSPLPAGEAQDDDGHRLPLPAGEGRCEGQPVGGHHASPPPGERTLWRVALPAIKPLAILSALSVGLYIPFFLGFSSQTKGIGISVDKTPLASALIIFGPFFLVLGVFLVWQYRCLSKSAPNGRQGMVLGAALMLALASWFVGAFSLLLGLLLLGSAIAYRLLRLPSDGEKPEQVALPFTLLLTLLGLLLAFVPEFIFVVDLFGTRMNTVFKFHYQAWLLLGVASSVVFATLLSSARSRTLRWSLATAVVLLVGVGLLYPFTATPSKTNGFKTPPTLDGAAFLQSARPDDHAAIQWLSRTVAGRPVVLEAVGGEYSEYARVSTFSGLPAVLGWPGHEVQWRGRGEEPARRTRDVEAIYRTADGPAALELLRRYGVQYVFVGSLEAEKYGPEVTTRFDGLLEPVHRQGRVVIYRVPMG